MTLSLRYPLELLPALVVSVCLLAGCSSTPPPAAEFTPNEVHLKRVVGLYSEYKSTKGTWPKNTAELKAWVKSMPKAELEKHNIDDVDKVFISPRDGQEYVIVPMPPKAPMGMTKVIAYEKTGVQGKHWKIASQGYINEVTTEQLDKLLQEVGQKR